MTTEKTILSQLIHNEDYARKVLPYLKKDYFENPSEQLLYELIANYVEKYNQRPSQEALEVDLGNRSGVPDTIFKAAVAEIKELKPQDHHLDWLVDTTEEFCKEKALYNGLLTSLEIIRDNTGKQEKGSIIQVLEDALAVSFDTHLGHDYIDDAERRYEFYHKLHAKLPFDLEMLNKITNGGLPDKTMTVLIGGVGFGKTATMCHMAAGHMILGKNVLYFTNEMAEEEISKRVDAHLLDTQMNDLLLMPKDVFMRKIEAIRSKTIGKLKIKEYPTAGAGASQFRHHIHELRIKQKFKPDVIYVDYLNICKSSRITLAAGLYQYGQAIAQELRGLAVEASVPLITATQLNRAGFVDSDPGMEHTSESFGVPAIADFMLALITSKELASLNQVMFKQIKNRFGNPNEHDRFILGRDLDKMRLFDAEGAELISQPINLTQERFEERKKLFEDFQ
jgi:replicative DNA helicase